MIELIYFLYQKINGNEFLVGVVAGLALGYILNVNAIVRRLSIFRFPLRWWR